MAKKIKKLTAEELMQLAIEESKKSIPEHTDKTDPLVGAIIAKDGVVLGMAHRGELRVGEHCEFTLIERKLANVNLTDCSLFVTLEPCTDKSRSNHKRGCSSHITKSRIKEVYVGIEDPNPAIARDGIELLRSKGITVHMFPAHLQSQILEDNKKFFEEKTEEAKQVAAVAPPPVVLEGVLEKQTTSPLSSLSNKAIQQFISTASLKMSYPSSEFTSWASQFGLIDPLGKKPTGLGLMLFGNEPETEFPQTIFKVEINYGDKESEIKDFSGPLVLQLPAILDFVRTKALKLTMDRSKGERTEKSDFPFETLREAIVNAMIHRDYSIEGGVNYLYIDPDKIIVRSPGTPIAPLILEDLQKFDTPSLSRNPKLMYIFNLMKFAEQRGVGLRDMQHLGEQGFPLPQFSMKANQLEVVFSRTQKSIDQILGKKLATQLTSDEKIGYLYIQSQGDVTKHQYAENFKFDDKKAQRHLLKFKQLGLVKAVGKAKATKYLILRK